MAVAPPPRRARRRITRTRGPAYAEFCSGNLRHTKGPKAGEPFVLEPWQRQDNDLIYELDQRGRPQWRNILRGLARGNGKSPDASGHGLSDLVSLADEPEIFVAAPDKSGAGIVQAFASSFVRGGPLRDFMTVGSSKLSPISCALNDGLMQVVAGDGDHQHGLSISRAIIDELHAFRTRKQEELYFALASATQKREDAIEEIITTAGWDKQTLLGEKYDAAMATMDLEILDGGYRVVGRDYASRSLFIWRGAPTDADPTDPRVWRKANPASWIPDEELRIMAHKLPLDVFRRLILNQWTEGESSAITAASWDACRVDGLAIEDGAQVWLAARVDEKRETAALAAVAPLPDGRRAVWCRVWEDADPAKLVAEVEKATLEACARWQHRSFAYDPWQLAASAATLADAGVRLYRGARATQDGMATTDSFMVPAAAGLFDAVAQRRLAHDGDRPLRTHALRAGVKSASRGSGWKLAPPPARRDGTSLRIDGVLAVAMALLACDEQAGHDGPLMEAW